ETPAAFVSLVPGHEFAGDLGDLPLKLSILFGLGREQLARQVGHALISLNAFEQRSKVRHPFGGSESELGGVAADGVAQLRAIADKPIAEANQHQVRIPGKATTLSGAWRPRDPVDDDRGGARA